MDSSSSSVQSKRHESLVQLNQQVMEQLKEKLAHEPGLINLKQEFLLLWNENPTTIELFQPTKMTPIPVKIKPGEKANAVFKYYLSAKIWLAHPLSDQAARVLFGGGDEAHKTEHSSQALTSALRHALENAEILFEGHDGSVVWKISDGLVAKYGRAGDTTEYSAMRYLAEHAPHPAIPQPHGLFASAFDSNFITITTYFPSMTLEKAWGYLTEENKLSIKSQLSDIVATWRSLPIPPGTPLGGLGGEGVKDYHGWAGDHTTHIMTTAKEFSDWQFSYKHSMPDTWREFVQSVTPAVAADDPIVFTHGDMWPANIMVDKDQDGKFYVTGIIDWEWGGAYPAYFERSKILTNFMCQDNGWWKYVPACLEPSSDAQRWLSTRLWHLSCR